MIYATFLALVALAVFSTVDVNAQADRASRCGRNEVRLPCGRRCEDRCNALRPRICRDLQCPDRGCRCREGFFRNPYNNQCVRRRDCIADGCAHGEILATCGRRCEGTCERPTEPQSCRGLFCRERRCRCDLRGGFVRHRNGRCVRIENCRNE